MEAHRKPQGKKHFISAPLLIFRRRAFHEMAVSLKLLERWLCDVGKDTSAEDNWLGFPAFIRDIHFPPHNLPIVHPDSCLVWLCWLLAAFHHSKCSRLCCAGLTKITSSFPSCSAKGAKCHANCATCFWLPGKCKGIPMKQKG